MSSDMQRNRQSRHTICVISFMRYLHVIGLPALCLALAHSCVVERVHVILAATPHSARCLLVNNTCAKRQAYMLVNTCWSIQRKACSHITYDHVPQQNTQQTTLPVPHCHMTEHAAYNATSTTMSHDRTRSIQLYQYHNVT